ncbi:MAG: glycosyltransferase family 39 protein [Phycisphaerae bacterium]|nr:glycosyltransferase family 39 protein [Phycisphaerae bacterium]
MTHIPNIHISSKLKAAHVCLLLICIGGAILRFWHLGAESLWLDEGATARRIQLTWPQLMAELFFIKNHPPFHYALLKVWGSLFGFSEFTMRFWSAVAGTVTIGAIYLTGKKLFSTKTALFAAAMVAVSYYNIRYSREARFYSFNILLPLVSMYFFMRIVLFNQSSWKICLGYVLASTLMLYNHYFGIFTLFAQSLFVVTELARGHSSLRKVARLAGLAAIIILLFSPWLGVVISGTQAYHQTSSIVLKRPNLLELPGTLVAFCGYHPVASVLVILTMLITIITLWPKVKRTLTPPPTATVPPSPSLHSRKIVLLILWTTVPVITPFIISYLSNPIFNDRYNGGAFTGFFLLAAYGATCLKFRHVQWVLIVGIIYCLSLPTRYLHREKTNEQWREATGYIEQNAEPGDLVLFDAFFCYFNAYKYYQKRTDLRIAGFPTNRYDQSISETSQLLKQRSTFLIPKKTLASSNAAGGPPMTEEQIHALENPLSPPTLIGGHKTVWLIKSHHLDQHNLLLTHLKNSYNNEEATSLRWINIYKFSNRSLIE